MGGQTMRASKLKRQILDAQKTWEKENKNQDIAGLPGYTQGVLKGFKETLRIMREFQVEQLRKDMAERKMVSRWNGVSLYRACRQAYGRLKYSDRDGALRALKRVLNEKEE
jgi:hypothetical protein